MLISRIDNNQINSKGYLSQVKKLGLKHKLATWDYATFASKENLEKIKKIENQLQNLSVFRPFIIRVIEFFRKDKFDITKKIEQEKVYKAEIAEKENVFRQKYNDLKVIIDGKKYSLTELDILLKETDDINLAKSFYTARNKGLEAVLEPFRDILRARNKLAVFNGYKNFYEYAKKTTNKALDTDSYIREIYSDDTMKRCIEEYDKIDSKTSKGLVRKKIYRISDDDYNIQIKDTNTIIAACKKMFEDMGFNLARKEKRGKLKFDLLPRKNKREGAFCLNVDPKKDVRILANLTPSIDGFRTLAHELGHAVYNFGVSTFLPIFSKIPKNDVTEGVAVFFETLINKEGCYIKQLPKKDVEEFKKRTKLAKAVHLGVTIARVKFEEEMYKNPEQDFNKLFDRLKKKYLFCKSADSNISDWFVHHYASKGMYYENYLYSYVLADQLYEQMRNTLGGNLTENKNSARLLNKGLFKYGSFYRTPKVLKKFLGTDVSTRFLMNDLKSGLNP